MAFTIVREHSVMGNMRVVNLKITADAATELIDSGLPYIRWFSRGNIKVTTANVTVFPNAGLTGTATAGYLGVTGCTSGDVFFVTCYGA